jgi:hypothetical protein
MHHLPSKQKNGLLGKRNASTQGGVVDKQATTRQKSSPQPKGILLSQISSIAEQYGQKFDCQNVVAKVTDNQIATGSLSPLGSTNAKLVQPMFQFQPCQIQ